MWRFFGLQMPSVLFSEKSQAFHKAIGTGFYDSGDMNPTPAYSVGQPSLPHIYCPEGVLRIRLSCQNAFLGYT